jgi:hypothetical protein
VLINDRPGVWCAMCGLVALPERRAAPVDRMPTRSTWRRILLGSARQDVRVGLAVALGLVVAGMCLGSSGDDGRDVQPSSSSSVR